METFVKNTTSGLNKIQQKHKYYVTRFMSLMKIIVAFILVEITKNKRKCVLNVWIYLENVFCR